MDLEIAVVGGGVAGVYSAWRLQQVKTEARMGLFEYRIASVAGSTPSRCRAYPT